MDKVDKILVGVISDTHIPSRAKTIPKEVLIGFKGVDYIIHAGDINSQSVIYELETIAPVYAVAGNTDLWHIQEMFGYKRVVSIGNCKIGIFHGSNDRSRIVEYAQRIFCEDNVSCVVFGHTHSPMNKIVNGVLYFNPGSPTDRRRESLYSYGILTIEGGLVSGEIIRFGAPKNVQGNTHIT